MVIVLLSFVLSSISSLILYILNSKDPLYKARLDTSNSCNVAGYIIVGYNCINENSFDQQEGVHRHIKRSFPSLFYDLNRTCWFYWKHGEEFTLRHVQRSFFIILSIRISQNRLIEVIFSLRHIDIAGTGIMMKNYSKNENPFTWAGELERFENLSTDIPDPILDPNGS